MISSSSCSDPGMARGFADLEAQPEARALEHGEWLALLLEREATQRRQKR
ncbi:MAG: ATP-binding protein, partial [Alphaproteobacteria bacterium]|nr:ATP-binding protein [Alphaproteobacteria bacterium]